MASAGQTLPFKVPDSMWDKYTRQTIVQVLVQILLTASYKNKGFFFLLNIDYEYTLTCLPVWE